jgi:lambda repressor-like predicted transcriptional regulator
MTQLKLQPEECSPLGLLILKHIEKNKISMNQLSRHVGCSQSGLRLACLRGTNPTEITLRKLSKVLKVHPVELYFLAYGDRIKALDDEPPNIFSQKIFEAIDQIMSRVPA